jgi:hypothetical protein
VPRLRLYEVRLIDIPNAMVYYVDERRWCRPHRRSFLFVRKQRESGRPQQRYAEDQKQGKYASK